ACYPIFAPVPEPRMYMLSIVRVDESGVESPVDVEPFARRVGLERWARLAQRLAASEPGTRRDTQGRALLALWQRSKAATAAGDHYRLYLETHGTEPGSRVRNPVATRLLADTGESVVSRAHPRADRGRAPSGRPPADGPHKAPPFHLDPPRVAAVCATLREGCRPMRRAGPGGR